MIKSGRGGPERAGAWGALAGRERSAGWRVTGRTPPGLTLEEAGLTSKASVGEPESRAVLRRPSRVLCGKGPYPSLSRRADAVWNLEKASFHFRLCYEVWTFLCNMFTKILLSKARFQ